MSTACWPTPGGRFWSLPAQGASTDFKRIVIGWNGSKEAARAVFDALPLLKEADDVEVLVVDPAKTPVRTSTNRAMPSPPR